MPDIHRSTSEAGVVSKGFLAGFLRRTSGNPEALRQLAEADAQEARARVEALRLTQDSGNPPPTYGEIGEMDVFESTPEPPKVEEE